MKINDKLYLWATPRLLSYVVFGILKRSDGTYYQIRCSNCNDHDDCELLIKKDDYGHYRYISMLNSNSDYDDPQHYWHSSGKFRTTKELAVQDYYLNKKEILNKSIKSLEGKLKEDKEDLIETDEKIKALFNKPPRGD